MRTGVSNVIECFGREGMAGFAKMESQRANVVNPVVN